MHRYSKSDITSILTRLLTDRPEILFAYLFGSIIESDRFRDVDVAVFVEPEKMPEDWLTYVLRLTADIEQAVGYRADVVLMNNAPDHLIHSIAKGILLIDRDEQFRSEWIERSLSRYFDNQPTRRRAVAELFT